jgi:hypothetical protein
LEDLYRTAKRATVGRSALGWIAFICLAASIAFWAAMFIDLLAPPRLFSPEAIQAGLAVIAFSLVQPLLWSMLLPSSPAGRLLQKQTWRTPGYTAVICAALFLTYHSWRWSYAWWEGRPDPAIQHEAVMLAITSLIAAVLMPALAWCVVTPEQWIAQIEQARHVKRLELAMKMEEAAMRATYARAVTLLNAGLSNLTIEQRREVGGILAGFARAQQQALTAIGRSWKDMYGVEAIMGGTPDAQLVEQYSQVVNLLADGGDAMADTADYVESMPALTAPPRETAPIWQPPNAADRAAMAREYAAASASRSIPSGPDRSRSAPVISDDPGSSPIAGDQSIRSVLTMAGAYLGPAPMDDEERAAIEVLPTAGEALAAMGFAKAPWMIVDLAKALHIDEGTARKIAAIWVRKQVVRRGPDKGLAKGRYQFTGVN